VAQARNSDFAPDLLRPVTVFADQESTYRNIARIIDQCDPAPSDRVIAMASLHGHSGNRVTEDEVRPPTGVSQAFAAFDGALFARMTSRDPTWRFRQLVNATNVSRLENLLRKVIEKESPRLEVRAFARADSLPMVSPLVVANEHAFFGPQDDLYYRAGSALYVRDRTVAVWATRYFDSLWDAAPFRIRTPAGIEPGEIQRLRAELERFLD
jgi:hypothetical protein